METNNLQVLIPQNSIVSTIGPVSDNEGMFRLLAEAGVTVARVNMSHGTDDENRETIRMIRRVSPSVLILGDLCGPKIRIGDLDADFIELAAGQECIVTSEHIIGNAKRFSVSYERFHEEVFPGMSIFIHDGKQVLLVKEIKGQDVHCEIMLGGRLRMRKGVNVPEAQFSISSITEKDKKDLLLLVEEKVDMVGLSFVRSAEHILELKGLLEQAGRTIPVISKIETLQALKNLESIVDTSDAVMVARGDLGVEIGLELVPKYQKEIVSLCNKMNKPVIVATEMMKSMTDSELPTRAEVSDVANAILDGATAVMTSGETALGKYPVETVIWMKKIIDIYKKA
ncbi:MAG: pyk [Patescibacteria group bacterium]|nr:pyk [Patescibacteria group bacterium]